MCKTLNCVSGFLEGFMFQDFCNVSLTSRDEMWYFKLYSTYVFCIIKMSLFIKKNLIFFSSLISVIFHTEIEDPQVIFFA